MIDSHAHLTSPDILPHVEEVVQRAHHAGLSHIINICTDPASLKEGLALEKRHPWIRNAGATTPHDVASEGESAFPLFAEAARTKKLIAVGETGLDYHYAHSPRPLQQQFLIRYLHLAAECHLPVIFHCREAFADLFSITDREYQGPAILHCFTGTKEEARQGLDRGWLISFSGIVTFKKSEALREIAQWIPLDRMLIETDAPFLAPLSQRGKLNEPSYLSETAACIAAVRGISPEEIARHTSENAKKVFRLPA